jgi:hypothetical protein
MDDYIGRIMDYRLQGFCCAQILLQLGLDEKGSENPELINAVKGLCGGMHSGLACGALTGGACLLSLLEPEKAHRKMIPALTEWFLEAYGTMDCKPILEIQPNICGDIIVRTYEMVKELQGQSV